jgi:hypothetical protein
MTMRWFGRKLAAPIYDDCPEVSVPASTACFRCCETIESDDDGFIDAGGAAFHRACFLRPILGSIAHQLGLCACHGHEEPCLPNDKPTIRQEAEAAVAFYESTH